MDNLVVSSGDNPALLAGLTAQGWPTTAAEPDDGQPYALVATADGAASALRRAVRSPQQVAVLVLVSPAPADPPLPPAELGRIQCPTLVVFGNDDPQSDAAHIYRAQIHNCHIALVYAAGPDIAAQRPQALLNLVADFLERRETFIVANRSRIINP